MRKFFAAAAVSAVALVGFAGTASAYSGSVSLLWPDGSDTTTLANPGDSAVLRVVLTAGEGNTIGGGVTVDYTDVAGPLDVTAFASTMFTPPLPFNIGTTVDTGFMVTNVNAAGGLGPNQTLINGASFVLGTVTFQRTGTVAGGLKEIAVAFTGTDHILAGDGTGAIIDNSLTLNSAFVNVPEPGAISLLIMGLGGMLLAGRGRRS